MPTPAATPPADAIAELDADLALATRTMKAATPADKPKWKHLIDGLLDRRLELMRRQKP